MDERILVIDEGTTSTRAIVYDRGLNSLAQAQEEVALSLPGDGRVEQDANHLWQASLRVCRAAVEQSGGVDGLAGIAIANQRETVIVWDRETGEPVAPALVWQDTRTAKACQSLSEAGHDRRVQAVTGLIIDPYFSATKLAWLLDQSRERRAAAEAGRLAFGTVDSWLIWKLTGGGVHAIDVTNASRTLLMDLASATWSEEMLALFNIPRAMLAEIRASAGRFGDADPELLGQGVPLLAAIGDQQGALFGQGCLAPGEAKVTYGTGAFLVANTGDRVPASRHRLLATKGYDMGTGKPGAAAFALEGAIFNAGTVVKWLRDELGLITQAADTEAMAAGLEDTGGVYFVPAFTGLGAPHWTAGARGEITGLNRATRAAHIVRAGLEAAVYQTHDLLDAFAADGAPVERLRVDGGMAGNSWLMQFLADICARPVERPAGQEMTALGAAALGAIALGWQTGEDWAERRGGVDVFEPLMSPERRDAFLAGWARAVAKALS